VASVSLTVCGRDSPPHREARWRRRWKLGKIGLGADSGLTRSRQACAPDVGPRRRFPRTWVLMKLEERLIVRDGGTVIGGLGPLGSKRGRGKRAQWRLPPRVPGSIHGALPNQRLSAPSVAVSSPPLHWRRTHNALTSTAAAPTTAASSTLDLHSHPSTSRRMTGVATNARDEVAPHVPRRRQPIPHTPA